MEDEELHKNKKSASDKSENIQFENNVFLSFPSEDLKLAQKVFSFLEKSGHRVFFSDETLHHPNFADEIDDALTGAGSMVLIGTRTESFFKNWVRYEWRTFHNDILSGRKPWKTPFITFTKTPDINSLPRPLANNQIIDFSKKTWGASLKELNDMLKSKKSDEFPGK